VLCAGIQRFLEHALPGLRELAAAYRREQDALRAPAAAPPGRNDPCPCGSGRKFKRCCAAGGAPPPRTGDWIGGQNGL
jgi:uncharacterized protein YecA (UPF0149 family)